MCGSKDGTAETKRADSRGNAHRGGENVVGEERGRGEQAGRCAKIEARHGIGAAAGGIGGDGLAIGKVHDHQQRDDGGADGNDIANAEKAKRDQKAEGRFRAVSSRAKAIETKDRDALRGADLLGAFVAGLDGLADNEIEYVHVRWSPLDCSHQENHDQENKIQIYFPPSFSKNRQMVSMPWWKLGMWNFSLGAWRLSSGRPNPIMTLGIFKAS